jgi:outer membrane lipoprotein SlyB
MKIIAMPAAIAAVLLLFGAAGAPAWAQKAGQSVTVQYGTVTGVREVDLKSGAVPGGAVVGGALGLASAGGKSSGKKARNALVGAAAGGAIAGAAQGSQKGMLYNVEIGASGMIQVVSDQREIRSGDCVAVERAGDTANIRRVSSGYCDKANEAAVKSVGDSARKEAEECAAAKQQLVEATSTQAADLAGRKVALLCND